MKIHSIEIIDYRSYKGSQKIQFSIDSKKNVTIILGVNGAGKTNILNAINWCLYGEETHLSKYQEKKPIINQATLAELKENKTAECCVKIVLGNEKPEYVIERKIIFQKQNNKEREIDRDFNVNIITERGWMEAPDPTYIVNNILLPKKIREYFLFDGERLDEYFKSGNEDLVKDAVLDVAQIGLIEKAERHLSDFWDSLNEEAAVSTDTKEILGMIEIYKKSKENAEGKIKEQEAQKKTAQGQLDEIKKILRDHPVALIRQLQNDRDEVDEEIEKIKDSLKNLNQRNSDRIISTAPFVFGHEAISEALKLLHKEFAEDRLPPVVEDIFLQKLLDSHFCICGTDLDKNVTCRKKLEKLLKTIPQNAKQLTGEAYDLNYVLEQLKKKNNDFFNDSVEYTKQISELSGQFETKNRKRREIGEKIGKHNIEEIENLENNREAFENAISEISDEIRKLQRDIERADSLIATEMTNFKKESRKEDRAKEFVSKSTFVETSLAILSKIKRELIDEIRATIENKTNEYFLNMIWKKKEYSKVKISSDYKISVIDRFGTSCLGSLYAGERQVLALSFMAALYEVSGFEMPAVIDTPLGRISGEPRENIARCLQDYLKNSQLTLLILDTEYLGVVEEIMSKRVGKEIKLEFSDEKSETKVIEHVAMRTS